MSGKLISTGSKTNNGLKSLNIDEYLNKKIISITIHVMPLSINKNFTNFQTVGVFFKTFIPMVVNPSLTHVAIQLNLENTDDILIIEYGQYLTKDSDLKNKGLFGSSGSSKEPREIKNDNIYYYINKDGVRITIFTSEKIKSIGSEFGSISYLISSLIASQYYNVTVKEFWQFSERLDYTFLFYLCECNIKNKIMLRELIDKFKGENWEARKYNVLTHNCQTFGAEVIKLLKAVRKNEKDKIRGNEKLSLPGCIISALWHNEDWSLTNTIGRIPIVGLIHDFIVVNK